MNDVRHAFRLKDPEQQPRPNGKQRVAIREHILDRLYPCVVHTHQQLVVGRNDALALLRGHHCRLQKLRQLTQFLRCPGDDSAAARDDCRLLGAHQNFRRPFDVIRISQSRRIDLRLDDVRLANRCKRIGRNFQFDRPWTARIQLAKRLMHCFRDLAHLGYAMIPLGDGLEHIELVFDFVKLPLPLAQCAACNLSRNQQHWR